MEAPRGILIHDYQVNRDGILTRVKLVTPGGNNNLAMNVAIRQIASAYLSGNKVTEGLLNRVEHGIRLYS